MSSVAEEMAKEIEAIKKELDTRGRIIEKMRDEARDLRMEIQRKDLEIKRLKEKCGEEDERTA